MAADDSPLLRVAEVAPIIHRSREHTYRLVREGVIPSARLANGRIVVPRAALESWLESLTMQALAGGTAHDDGGRD